MWVSGPQEHTFKGSHASECQGSGGTVVHGAPGRWPQGGSGGLPARAPPPPTHTRLTAAG